MEGKIGLFGQIHFLIIHQIWKGVLWCSPKAYKMRLYQTAEWVSKAIICFQWQPALVRLWTDFKFLVAQKDVNPASSSSCVEILRYRLFCRNESLTPACRNMPSVIGHIPIIWNRKNLAVQIKSCLAVKGQVCHEAAKIKDVSGGQFHGTAPT